MGLMFSRNGVQKTNGNAVIVVANKNRIDFLLAQPGREKLHSAIQCKSLPPVINWMKSKPGTGPNSDAPYYWRASIGDYQHRLRITSCLLTGDVFMANDDKFFFVSFLFSFPCSFLCASLSVPVLLSTALVVQCRLINLCWNIRISPSAVECHDFSFWYFGMRKKSDKWPFSAVFLISSLSSPALVVTIMAA